MSGQDYTELNLSIGNSHYENWEEGKPTEDGECVGISNTDMRMTNLNCTSAWPFYCFTDNLVLVKENKTWEEALEQCRAMDLADPSLLCFKNHSNDLISISNHSDQLTVWTGLRYLAHSWFWVDGSDVPYQDLPHCPDRGQYCGTLVRDNSTIL
ncbi:hypothetical protein N1851_021754 [Merluccius polli]|uniref:C-type lectin domain-containing protein n=1 Tax=Merluccius polli TaxID=89951 RepID=A0AA47MJF8_MERPO|nr:hypothetical protein N1851_021754 [Merluccius polli]